MVFVDFFVGGVMLVFLCIYYLLLLFFYSSKVTHHHIFKYQIFANLFRSTRRKDNLI